MIAMLPLRRLDRFLQGSSSSSEEWEISIGSRLDELVSNGRISAERRSDIIVTLGLGIYADAALQVAGKFAAELLELNWHVFEFNDDNLDLVISDRPLIRKAEGQGVSTYLFPVTPNHLFAASSHPIRDTIMYQQEFSQILLVRTISMQFQQSSRFVIATKSDPYKGLAEKYMKTSDQNPIVGTI